MLYPFIRPEERLDRDRPVRASFGIRVTYPSNVQHWFPGPESIALVLARHFCPEELLNHKGTTIEVGERAGTLFVLHRHLAGPVISKVNESVPRIITPGPT